MEILSDNDANWLVQYDDGSVDTVTKSPLNRLLFEHDLWGLLKRGDEIVTYSGDDKPDVTVISNDDATEYILKLSSSDDKLHLGEHQKPRLIEALHDVYSLDEGVSVEPLLELYDDIREGMVRKRLMEKMASYGPFANTVELVEDGWLIHGHLLLTWECEFYHPDTTSRNPTGGVVIEKGSRATAYELRIGRDQQNTTREITLDGNQYRLTDSEMEFVARAIWAVAEAPRERQHPANQNGLKGTPGLN